MSDTRTGHARSALEAGEPTRWLTLQQIADELEVSMATVYGWRYDRDRENRPASRFPKAYRIGRSVKVRREDFEAWVETLVDTDTTTDGSHLSAVGE